ncbi:MAG: argininosuccinate lyase [Pseudomonadota bacterium]|nr:argininosuccinate lyase [Pseudomonadota bacterium]
MKLWGGRFSKETAKEVETFSSSIHIDSKMWEADIKTSVAHARMLGDKKIISLDDSERIIHGLQQIKAESQSGEWTFDDGAEDIHGAIEQRLFQLIGIAAKKIHTARSRNDQVATDTRLYLHDKIKVLTQELKSLQKQLVDQAQKHTNSILPGMTHLQHAQPVSLAHHLMAYFWMFQRDVERLMDSLPRILSLPLGSAALAGTGFPIDRQMVCEELQFSKVCENSLDGVSDRDFVIEFLADASIIMMHLSRFCEELILWNTPEFNFVELGDEVTTGSSIMPQKKNPDMAELIRGRVGRVYGALMGALTMMKALPLSYNRDMQEDKEHLFQGLETVLSCVQMMNLMLQKTSWKTENMSKALKADFSNATDLADDLVEKGLSFREAHEVVGHIVQDCISNKIGLEDLSLNTLKKFHVLFDQNTTAKLSHRAVMNARTSEGGTSPTSVEAQIAKAYEKMSLSSVVNNS